MKKMIRTKAIKHPRMAQSSAFKAKLRDEHEDAMREYAEGGVISAASEKRANVEEEHNDSKEISRNEHMHAQDINHREHPMDDMDQFNHQPEEEAEIEDHASLAAAVMSRRKKMAEGGEIHSHDSIYSDDSDQADLSRNADEDANEVMMSFNALRKENYSESEGLEQLDQPMDSNEHGQEADDDHDQDVVSAIRRKMRVKSAISR